MGLRWALDPVLGDVSPTIFAVGATAVAAGLGGFWPALTAALAGYAAVNYLFIAPRHAFALAGAREWLQLAGYALSSLVIAVLGGVMQRAREAIARSERRFRNFMENTPNAVFLKDDAGRYLFMNRAAQALIGDAPWQGRTDHELLPAPVAARIVAHDRQVLASDRAQTYELSLPQPDGERYLYSTKFPLHDAGGERYVASITVDVTERKRAEEELQLVTDTMSAAVIRCAADTRILWANRVYCEWMGRCFADVVGRPLVEIIGESALQEIRPYIAAVLRRYNGRIALAARALGIQRTNLYRKARQLGLQSGGGPA